MNSPGTSTTEKKSKGFLWSRILTIIVALIAIIYFFPHPEADNNFRYKVGEAWQYDDLNAPFNITVPRDSAKMSQQLDSLNRNFVYFYNTAPADIAAINRNIEAYYRAKYETLSDSLKASTLSSLLGTNKYAMFLKQTKDIVNKHYKDNAIIVKGTRTDAPDHINVITKGNEYRLYDAQDFTTTGEIAYEIEKAATDLDATGIIDDGKIGYYLPATVVQDSVRNKKDFEAERTRIEANVVIIPTGQTIIHKNEVVTPHHDTILKEYRKIAAQENIDTGQSMFLVWFGQGLYTLILMGLFVVYIIVFEPKVWNDMRAFGFVIGITSLFFVIAAIMSGFLKLGLYVVPLAIAPILVLVFFNGRIALWTGVILALLTGGMATFGFEYIFLQVSATAAAVFSLRDLTQRSQLLKTAGFIGLTYIVGYLAVQLLTNGSFDGIRLRMIGVLALNAALTSMAYVLMFGVERLFGFISNVTLVELTDVNAPLLRALSDECPGTFNHVVAVANLAGDAARQIGANSLLTRAGAMYHDIGKLSNPMFFTENQHGVNPHDGLSPLKSAEIIISHVTDGLRRAEKAGLPPVIRDFISEHHGAGQAKYFYFTYCKQHPDETVDPAPFTYPGPNPRTRETSVLMMADSVEAASRSLKEHTPKAISDLVNKIIDGQIADGLHNNSPLSFNDIRTIKEAFTRRLMTMYHSRIAYPEDPNKAKS